MALGRLGPQVSAPASPMVTIWCPWSYLSLGHRWFKAEEVSKLMPSQVQNIPQRQKPLEELTFLIELSIFTLRLTWGLWKLVVVNKNKRLQDLENGTGGWFLWVLCLKNDSLMKVYTPLHKINCNPIQLTTWRFILMPSGSEAFVSLCLLRAHPLLPREEWTLVLRF